MDLGAEGIGPSSPHLQFPKRAQKANRFGRVRQLGEFIPPSLHSGEFGGTFPAWPAMS